MLIESFLLASISILLSGIGASFFHEGCAHAQQSERHDRVLGFAALLVSISTLAISWSQAIDETSQVYGFSGFVLLTLLSLMWPISFAIGWYWRRARSVRHILAIITGAISTLWLIAHDQRLSAADFILALGLLFWLASFAMSSRRKILH
jgi:hypothetical protein